MSNPHYPAGGTVYLAEFRIGERVFLALADERKPGLVTGIHFRPGAVTYSVSWGDASETGHYDFELTREFVPDYGADGDG